ncbi:MAG: OsmC family protein [Chloroflexi bacterium]|nr:OsmC family protein [Chloroflexota bacterium]
MTILNNVNVGALEQIAREANTDKSKVKRSQRIDGEWLLEAGGPQFRAEVSFEGGKVVFESDQPKNLGGGGTRPGPLHYCFFGLVACYTASFAAAASQLGIKLTRLTARLEGNLDFSRVFGLSQEPVMKEIRIALQVEADVPRQKLEEAEKLAYERCPAVYALTQPVKLTTSLEVNTK